MLDVWWAEAVLLGVSAGILFSPGATEEGSIAPLFMVLLLEAYGKPHGSNDVAYPAFADECRGSLRGVADSIFLIT